MIEAMTKYSFILLNGDKSSFLEKLQELGVVDISRSSKTVDEFSQQILNNIDDVKAEIKSLQTGSDAYLARLLKDKAELEKTLAEAQPWGDYDKKRLSALGISFFCVPSKKYDKSWEEHWAIQIVREAENKIWFVIIGDKTDFPINDILVPSKTVAEIKSDIKSKDKEISHHKAVLDEGKVNLPQLEKQVQEMSASLNVYLASISAESAAENSLAIFTGFAPTKEVIRLKDVFDCMDLYYISEAATVADNPPIKIKNNWFSKQFEPLTGMYGLPVYNEFDPTIPLSIFFLLFFAMCMGDAGYGIILVIIGLFLKGKSGGLAKMWQLVVTLGIGTFVVGLVMGGFLGIDLSAQSWVPDWSKRLMICGDMTLGGGTYAKQMVLSLLIGILHISLALILKAVWTIKKNGFKNSLSALGWTTLFVGGIVGLAIGLTGIISEEQMKWVLIGIASISALGIFIFNRWGRNPLANIGVGLWDTYSMASGLMGDVLSYIRLYALGLSGSMLGSTFNQIADMIKGTDPTWQWVPFVIVLLVGHALNLAMSCLGAFVHPLRLNFVEFFKNSGYEGRGTVYNPLTK